MSYLFKIQGKEVKPNPETLMIPPFNKIWERDRTKSKKAALEDFAYIEFTSSVKESNPFREFSEKDREKEVRKSIITRKNWKPDKKIEEGIEKIIDFQQRASTTYSYYMSAKIAAEKINEFFRNFDINSKTEKGSPVYKPKDITNTLNDTEKIITNLKKLDKKVQEELKEETRIKSDKKISYFADPESFK